MTSRDSTALLAGAAGLGLLLIARAAARRREYDLRGKTVLVTGGSRGLGLVMARELESQGARVAICARDPADLDRARDYLVVRGGQVFAVSCDLSDRGQAEALVRRVDGEFGPIDVLINNAGVIEVGPVETMNLADFEEAMRVNFWAALYTTLAALPTLRRRRGRIVNICSIGGKVSVPHLLPYCASKFALTGFSEGLHAELAKDGVVVTTVCPHLMRTGSPPNAYFKGHHWAEYTWFSLGDSLPLFSMSAESAARRIITALRRGEAEVILTLQANVAARLNALFPSLASDLMGLVNRLLPGPGGIGTRRALGGASTSALSPSLLTALGDRASVRNNENG
jgi:short-subunit dehydrogenase